MKNLNKGNLVWSLGISLPEFSINANRARRTVDQSLLHCFAFTNFVFKFYHSCHPCRTLPAVLPSLLPSAHMEERQKAGELYSHHNSQWWMSKCYLLRRHVFSFLFCPNILSFLSQSPILISLGEYSPVVAHTKVQTSNFWDTSQLRCHSFSTWCFPSTIHR